MYKGIKSLYLTLRSEKIIDTMKEFSNTLQEKRALAIATAIALVLGAYFLSSYFIMFVVAGVLAYLFNPIFVRYQKHMSKGSAAGLTLLTSILSIVIPLSLVFFIAGVQLSNTISSASDFVAATDFTTLGANLVETLNKFLDALPFIDVTVTQENIVNAIGTALQSFAENILGLLAGIAGSVGAFFTTIIIYIYVFLSVLKNGDKILMFFKKINPLGEQISDLYITQTAAMVRGTVQGQFIIAACQGLISASALAIAGYSNLFFFWFILFTMLSIIPLGAGILLIPMGVLIALMGNVPGGVFVILVHLLINTNIDNILRPILVPKEARLDSALMLVSVFSGIHFFGFLGIIIGPTIMVLIVTTVKVYLYVYENYQVTETQQKPKKSRFNFLRRKKKTQDIEAQ